MNIASRLHDRDFFTVRLAFPVEVKATKAGPSGGLTGMARKMPALNAER